MSNQKEKDQENSYIPPKHDYPFISDISPTTPKKQKNNGSPKYATSPKHEISPPNPIRSDPMRPPGESEISSAQAPLYSEGRLALEDPTSTKGQNIPILATESPLDGPDENEDIVKKERKGNILSSKLKFAWHPPRIDQELYQVKIPEKLNENPTLKNFTKTYKKDSEYAKKIEELIGLSKFIEEETQNDNNGACFNLGGYLVGH